jgi:PiT family inorganic phosphate transporter
VSSILAVLIGLLLSYANGANDNFKGVATLFGSGTTNYRRALLWATITTALGSIAALIVARGLLAAFSGKGLVPTGVVTDPSFPVAVALSAGTTVLLATRLGFPISTTHALIGALVGAGLLASPQGLNLARLGSDFLFPLLTSPFIAILVASALYPPLHSLRGRLGIEQETCVCIGTEVVGVVPGSPGVDQALRAVNLPTVSVGRPAMCRVRYRGQLFGVNVHSILDLGHYLSAGVVSFARGLNDTPKIAALLLVGNMLDPSAALLAVGIAIATGGLLSARRVAETVSHRVTTMKPGQGLTANAVTGLLVIGASHFGMPVSTTHVSCGSLFGIGAVTRQAQWKTIGQILLAWITTLPIASIFGVLFLTTLEAIS